MFHPRVCRWMYYRTECTTIKVTDSIWTVYFQTCPIQLLQYQSLFLVVGMARKENEKFLRVYSPSGWCPFSNSSFIFMFWLCSVELEAIPTPVHSKIPLWPQRIPDCSSFDWGWEETEKKIFNCVWRWEYWACHWLFDTFPCFWLVKVSTCVTLRRHKLFLTHCQVNISLLLPKSLASLD